MDHGLAWPKASIELKRSHSQTFHETLFSDVLGCNGTAHYTACTPSLPFHTSLPGRAACAGLTGTALRNFFRSVVFFTSNSLIVSPSILRRLAVETLHLESNLRDIHVPSSANPTCFVVVPRTNAGCIAPGCTAPGPFLNARYGS